MRCVLDLTSGLHIRREWKNVSKSSRAVVEAALWEQ
jgi:hypothetical protein